MAYEFKKVDSTNITDSELTKILAEGWEAVGPMEDKLDAEGNVIVKKSHIIRFRREAGGDTGDDVVLTPDKVFAKIGIKMKANKQ